MEMFPNLSPHAKSHQEEYLSHIQNKIVTSGGYPCHLFNDTL